jgi:predicted metal-dependent hydrolase
MTEETLHIDQINITLFKSTRAKSLNITIKPFSGVRVSVPKSVSFKKAKDIVEQRMDWIKKHLSRMQKAEEMFTVFDWSTEFKTREHELRLVQSDNKVLRATVRNGQIRINIPKETDISTNKVQQEIRKGIERAWRKEAKAFLTVRLEELAKIHGFSFKKITIQNAKTRWGSCSFDNSINLSLHLMRLPDYLIDYVILHELVHTKIKNHSPQFWQLLDQVSGNARKLDREVKQYRIEIY